MYLESENEENDEYDNKAFKMYKNFFYKICIVMIIKNYNLIIII